jgi:hypothetical protein
MIINLLVSVNSSKLDLYTYGTQCDLFTVVYSVWFASSYYIRSRK